MQPRRLTPALLTLVIFSPALCLSAPREENQDSFHFVDFPIVKTAERHYEEIIEERVNIEFPAAQGVVVFPEGKKGSSYFRFSNRYYLGEEEPVLIASGRASEVNLTSREFLVCAAITFETPNSWGLIHALGGTTGKKILAAIIEQHRKLNKPFDRVKISITIASKTDESSLKGELYSKKIRELLEEQNIQGEVEHSYWGMERIPIVSMSDPNKDLIAH